LPQIATNYEDGLDSDRFVTENYRAAQIATRIAGFLSERS